MVSRYTTRSGGRGYNRVILLLGILTLQPTAYAKSKAAGLTRHQLAMLVTGFPAAVLGYAAIFFTKIINGRAHFTTWHGVGTLFPAHFRFFSSLSRNSALLRLYS